MYETEPVVEILPAIPDAAKHPLLIVLAILFFIFWCSAKAASAKVSLPWLAVYWWHRLWAKGAWKEDDNG